MYGTVTSVAAFVARRLGAWIALVAFSASFGIGWSASSHHEADNDADCGQVQLASSHPRVQFEAAKDPVQATHCAFCHWQRAVSGARLTVVQHASLSLQPIGRPVPPASRTPQSAALDQHASRGPPSEI